VTDRYDFDAFLSRMAELDYLQILTTADAECASVERASFGKKGAVRQRELGSVKYASRIKAFLYFMRFGSRPGSATDSEFQSYRVVAEALVKKEQFKPSILDLFK
jgi:hypothetical protein